MFFMREFFTAVGVSMGFWIFIPLILPCSFMFASAYMDYKIHRDMVRDSKSNKKQYYIFKLKPYQMIIVKILLAIEIVRLVLP